MTRKTEVTKVLANASKAKAGQRTFLFTIPKNLSTSNMSICSHYLSPSLLFTMPPSLPCSLEKPWAVSKRGRTSREIGWASRSSNRIGATSMEVEEDEETGPLTPRSRLVFRRLRRRIRRGLLEMRM